MLKILLAITALAVLAVLAAVSVTGCSDSDSDGSSGSDLANLASPGSVVFVEAQLQPGGELRSNVDSVVRRLTGEPSLSSFVATQLERFARGEGESLDFAEEVEPWLGSRGGVAFERLVDGELSEPLIAVETTDAKEAQAFVDTRTEQGRGSAEDASYKGVDFKIGGPKDGAIGVIGEALVLADGEREFKAAVDASEGDSLGGEDRFQKTMEAASGGSFADVYIDVGGIVEQSQDEIDAPIDGALRGAGTDLSDATAVASVIPGSDRIEIDVSSELGGEELPSGNASNLLGSLPASSFAALGFAGFDQQVEEAIDNLDEEGIPPALKPGELETVLQQAGVDPNKIAESLDEAAFFVKGSNKASLGGAMVVTAKSSEAAKAVGNLGSLLRAVRVPGFTAVGDKASGFSIRSDVLGEKALVVIGKGNRIAIGYGLAQAIAGLNAGSGATLSGTPSYKAAVSALGNTPINGFVDGPAALRLAEALVPRSKSDFWEAVPYLRKIGYVGIGRGADGEPATVKLIAGIGQGDHR